MMFNIHTDSHDSVQGYLVPNSFSERARIRVEGDGTQVFCGTCDIVIDDLVRIGRHETGLSSFVLDTTLIPHLPDLHDLRVFDADTGLMIYRRNHPDRFVQQRVFRLETTRTATTRYANALLPHFAYGLGHAHLFGHETINQLFNLGHYPSMYFDGRIHIKPHQNFLKPPLLSVASVDEPFVALAQTIVSLWQAEEGFVAQLEEREYAALLPLAGFLDGVAIDRPEAVRARMKAAPKAILASLESPLVGLLTGDTPGVGGTRRDIPGALDMLSLFELVILGQSAALPTTEFAQTLGLNATDVPQPHYDPLVLTIADALRDLSVLQTALEHDLIVYHCVAEAWAA